MGILQRLFGKGSAPQAEAAAPIDRDGFLHFIAREGAWLLTKGTSEHGQATFIDYIDEQGRHIWPLFSTQAAAATWIRKSGGQPVTSFPCMQLTPEGLLDSLPKGAHVLFDPKSPHERLATADDIAFLRGLVAAPPST
jgi:hypothetical protein